MKIGKRIRQIRLAKEMGRGEFALKLGVSPSYVSDIESAENLTLDTIKKVAKVLEVSVAELVSEADERHKTIPLLARVPAGGTEAIPRETILDWLTMPGVTDPNAFAVRVEGNSMEPAFQHDDIVIVSPSSPLSKGDVCLAVHEEGIAVIKRYYRRGEDIILTSDNPDYEPIVWKGHEIRFLGKVIGKFQTTD